MPSTSTYFNVTIQGTASTGQDYITWHWTNWPKKEKEKPIVFMPRSKKEIEEDEN